MSPYSAKTFEAYLSLIKLLANAFFFAFSLFFRDTLPPSATPMATYDPSFLPPDRFYTNQTFPSLITHLANQRLFRVHALDGRGAPIPGTGFISSAYDTTPSEAQYNAHYTGRDPLQLKRCASAHITQWKDGTESMPSVFISTSFSLAYALFEARRWNARYGCTTTQISVIDPLKIPSDKWLGTELIGAWWETPSFFARWAEEALIYGHIPHEAIVFTASLETFLSLLPRWCGDIIPQIRRYEVRSSENMVQVLASAAEDPANNTVEKQEELLVDSVRQSITLLGHLLPSQMQNYNVNIHADAVDKISRFAAIFCWWPEWITSTDPSAYPNLLGTVREKVLERAYRRFGALEVRYGDQSRHLTGLGLTPDPSSESNRLKYSEKQFSLTLCIQVVLRHIE
ncbi:hypothetical protein B0H13DRAFT_1857662 [Mycena leptocephala]|nr:hypothetical protein B0H13DRAFT_1857662 [Mycena leptocephala]